jgi:hypothetical protein
MKMRFIKKIKTLLFPPVDAKKVELIVHEITMKADDKIVFSYEGILSNDQKERLRQAAEPWLKGEIKTLILEKDIRVTVVRGHKQ